MTLTALAGRGRINEAILHFRRAVRISPKYAESHCNLGIVLASRGRIAGAVEQYRALARPHDSTRSLWHGTKPTAPVSTRGPLVRAKIRPSPAGCVKRMMRCRETFPAAPGTSADPMARFTHPV